MQRRIRPRKRGGLFSCGFRVGGDDVEMKPHFKPLLIILAAVGATMLFSGCDHYYHDEHHHRGHHYGEAERDRREAEYDRREEWRDDRRREARNNYYH